MYVGRTKECAVESTKAAVEQSFLIQAAHCTIDGPRKIKRQPDSFGGSPAKPSRKLTHERPDVCEHRHRRYRQRMPPGRIGSAFPRIGRLDPDHLAKGGLGCELPHPGAEGLAPLGRVEYRLGC
jgi:hypothetical protein